MLWELLVNLPQTYVHSAMGLPGSMAVSIPTTSTRSRHWVFCHLPQPIHHKRTYTGSSSSNSNSSSGSRGNSTMSPLHSRPDTIFQTPSPGLPSEPPTTLCRAVLSTPHPCHTSILRHTGSNLSPPTLFLRHRKMGTTFLTFKDRTCTTSAITSLSDMGNLPYTNCTAMICMVDLCNPSF